MPSKKTKTTKKSAPVEHHDLVSKVKMVIVGRWTATKRRVQGLLVRRPHRSFRQTRRRDYVRPLRLPGYWAFTNQVRRILVGNKKLFFGLIAFYGILTGLLTGLASQESYSEMGELIRDMGGEFFSGNFSDLDSAGVTLLGIATGAFSSGTTEAQGIYAVLLALLVWLSTVWLLRAIMAGKRPRLRDGLYNAAAPILSTFLVMFVVVLQLLPITLVIIGYSAAASTGLLDGGVEAMIFWVAAGLLVLLSLYWISSTLLALVVVTLPGMYPLQAVKTAGDLVIGRRIRMLLRVLWLLLIIVLTWVVVMIPLILLDAWVKGLLPAIDWLPVIPVALLVMGSLTVIWSASYVYMLYRKVVDDDAAPS
jgi:hypothetical protein